MPKVERKVIEERLDNAISEIRKSRSKVNKIKEQLLEHGVMFGETQNIISGKTSLSDLSLSMLGLVLMKVASESNDLELNPEIFFTESEIKDIKTFEILPTDTIELPYTFENVTFVKEGNFSTIITAQQIKQLMDSNILVYNFDTQREAKLEKGKDDEIILKPKTNPKSVSEIADLLLAGELETSTITLNARVGTSEEGDEVVYNPRNRTLTVTKGTLLDILDGYHRISGINVAASKDPEIDAVFDLKILNYGRSRALKYFFQINKTNPISESRRKEANIANMTTSTIEELRVKSNFLQGKISNSDKIFKATDQLVSFNVLSDAIEDYYNPSNKLEAIQLADYLAKFFDELMFNNAEAFITNINEVRKHSLINANQMFYGYVYLSKIFKDHDIPLTKLQGVIDTIDFSRDNPLWTDRGILSEEKQITANPKRKIKEVFEEVVKSEVLT